MKKIKSTAPGRICLFGEHQDYMALPVITAAIGLVIETEGSVGKGGTVDITMPDTDEHIVFPSDNIIYESKKDYLKSGFKVLKDKGLIGNIDVNAILKGNIPIKAGTSSSSALTVSWVGFLLSSVWTKEKILNNRDMIAEFAYLSEVEEFGESGGRMDQYASALGKINYFTFHDEKKHISLPAELSGFVLGDSGEPKDTQKTLKRVRTAQESGLKELNSIFSFKDNFSVDYEIAKDYFNRISPELRPYLRAVLINHKITEDAKSVLFEKDFNKERVASLMNSHHAVLRDELKLSTKKIEKMVDVSLNAGALSAKINGSGEGGCMFAYCPGKEEQVSEAIKSAGGTPYILDINEGLTVEITE